MRVLVQRSLNSSVSVDGKTIGKIDKGLVLFVGFTLNDSESEIEYLVNKILHLRIFDDEKGVMNKSILDVSGDVLSISQFTLYGDTNKGHRPIYFKALNSIKALELYKIFNEKLNKFLNVQTGEFGAEMLVNINNDGPVTILLEKEKANDKK